LLLWGLFLLIDIAKKSLFLRKEFDFIYYYYFPGFIYWVLLTIPAYKIFLWSSKFHTWLRISFLLSIAVLIGTIKNLISWSTFYIASIYSNSSFNQSFTEFIKDITPFYYIEAVIIGCVVIAVFYILELNQRYKEKSIETAILESQLAQSKLLTLKMQLHPHFLFNAHNTISMLIRTQKYDQAVNMISGLSDLLRTTLTDDVKQFITLKEEIEYIKKYLSIEEIRFEDNLDISFIIDKEALSLKVPSLILQPVIENAFKHGISKFLGHSKLTITASLKDNYLLLEVFNTGYYLKETFDLKKEKGIGLTNTSKRLEQLYKGKAKFELTNNKRGVSFKLYIPQIYE